MRILEEEFLKKLDAFSLAMRAYARGGAGGGDVVAHGERRAARERLKGQAAGPGEKVEHAAAGQIELQAAEYRFLHAVQRRPRRQPGQRLKPPPAGASSNHAQIRHPV